MINPKPLLGEIGAQTGEEVEVTAEGDRIVIVPIRASLRQGWAEDARRVAEGGDDRPVWPEFGNEGDQDLAW